MAPTDHAKSGFQRLLAPLADFLVARGVSPNSVTTVGTALTVVGGVIYGWGHIHLAGWVVGLSAICDMLDGAVARKSGRSSVFGAFYDSTLDRVADGAVLGGMAVFFARNGVHYSIPVYMSTPMVSITIVGMIGAFLTSYTRARAEALGIDAKVGILQRPERIVLLSAPQAFFGLALGGWVMMGICVLLAVTAWITVVQRVQYVYRYTARNGEGAASPSAGAPAAPGDAGQAYAGIVRPGVANPPTAADEPRAVDPAVVSEARLVDTLPPGGATRRPDAPQSPTIDATR